MGLMGPIRLMGLLIGDENEDEKILANRQYRETLGCFAGVI